MNSPVETARRADKTRTCILILGMHRSGTSALSGVLSLLGCDQAKTLMPPSPSNEKGHFESQKVYELHRELLESAGTSWDDWTEFHAGWLNSSLADEFQERALDLLEDEFGSSRLFTLKDPRICRLSPFWLETLNRFGATPRIVLTHRNPLEVAASLQNRNDFEIPFGLLLWLRHVLDAENSTRGLPRYFTSFNALMDNWLGVVQGMQKALDVSFPRMSDTVAENIEDFLDNPLKHFNEKSEKVTDSPRFSQWVRTTYVVLEKWAAQGEDFADHAILDKVRHDFNDAAPAFSRLVKDGQSVKKQISDSAAALSGMQERLADAENRLDEESTRRASIEQTLTTARENLGKANTTLLQRNHEAEAAAKALSAAKQVSSGLEQSLAEEAELHLATKATIADMQAELTSAKGALTKRSQEVEDAVQQVAALTTTLTEKQARIDKLQQALSDEESIRAATAADLQKSRDDEAQIRSALAQRSLEAEEVNRDLQALRATTEAAEAAHARQVQELERKSEIQAADLAERIRDAQAMTQRVETCFREIGELTKLLIHAQAQAAEVGPLREKLAKSQANMIAQAEASKAAHARQVQELKRKTEIQAADLAERTRDAQATTQKVETCFREIGELTKLLLHAQAQAAEIAPLREKLAKSQADLTAQSEAQSQKIKELRQKADAAKTKAAEQQHGLETRIATRFRELGEVTKMLTQSEQNYEKILASRSWRITAPLRRIGALLRRFRP